MKTIKFFLRFTPVAFAFSVQAEVLTWEPVTQYEDGTPLLNPAYYIYCGRESSKYSYRSPGVLEPTFTWLVTGNWYCAATASDGNMESDYSNEIAVKNSKPGSLRSIRIRINPLALTNPAVHEVTTRSSGVLLAWFSYLDQNGKKFIIGPFKYPSGTDLAAEATNNLPYARQERKQQEMNSLLSQLRAGKDSLSVAQGPFTQLQTDQVVKQILKEAMQEEDPIAMIRIQSLMTYLNTNYPGDLLASFLGVPTAKTTALRTRYSAALVADISSLRTTDQWQ